MNNMKATRVCGLIFLGLTLAVVWPHQLTAQVKTISPTCNGVNGQCDDIPPNLMTLMYTPTSVNAASEDAKPTFVISGTALDPLSGTELTPPQAGGVASGVNYAYLEFVNYPCTGPYPAQQSAAWAYLYPQGSFTPGVTQNLSGTLYVESKAPSGTYYPCYAVVYDNLGNAQEYSLFSGQSTLLSALPTVPIIGCTVCTAPPPALTGFAISPTAMDVTNGDGTFTAILNVTDGGSGLSLSNSYVYLYWTGAANSYYWASYDLAPYNLVLLSGNANTSQDKAQIRIPRYSQPGSWMAYVVLCDNSSNCQSYQPNQLAALGFQSTVTVTDSTPDTTPPQMVSLSFSEFNNLATTNLVDPEVPITVTLNMTDVTATGGVSGQGNDGYSGCNPYMYATSQNQFASGSNKNSTQSQYVYFSLAGANLPSATVTWTGTLMFPKLSEIGQWNITVYSCDRAGNYSTFTGPASLNPAYVYLLYKNQTPPALATGTVTDASGASITIPPGLKPTPGGGGTPATNATVEISVTPVPSSVACGQTSCPAPGFYDGFKATTSPFVNYMFADAAGDSFQHVTFPFPGTTITLPHVVTVPPAVVGSVDSTLTLWSIENGVSSIAQGCKDPSNGLYSALNPTVIDNNGDVQYSHVCDFSTFYVMQKTGVPGDVNGDMVVDCNDVAIVKGAFGTKQGQPGFDPRADLNNDGIVNILDLSFVIKQLAPGTVCH